MNENQDQEAGEVGAQENYGPLPPNENAVAEGNNQLMNPQQHLYIAEEKQLEPEVNKMLIDQQLMALQNAIDNDPPIDLEVVLNQEEEELETLDPDHPVHYPEVVIPSESELIFAITNILGEVSENPEIIENLVQIYQDAEENDQEDKILETGDGA